MGWEEGQNSKREQRVRVRVVGMSVRRVRDTVAWIVMSFAMRWCIIVLDALVVVRWEGKQSMAMAMWL